MASQTQHMRDTRIDVFRALVLLTIFVNHVPGTVFENFTHKHFGFSDAAEAFVLMSGMAAALAYGPKFVAGNRILLAIKAWRRAGVLYVAHIMTTIASLAIFSAAALHFSRPDLLKLINVQTIIEDTPAALIGLATLGHQIGYANILPMYAAVLLMLPVFLLLSTVSIGLMVAVSGIIWLAAGVYQLAPANFPTSGLWFLNPASWQFLFVIGFAAILHVRRGGEIRFNPWLAGAAAGYVLVSLAWVRIPLWGIDVSMGQPTVLTGFDKTFLSLSRLLHILSLGYLIAAIPALSNLARTSAEHPLAILGRHALPVFIAGTLLAMVAQIMKIISPGGLVYDAVLLSTGIMLQFALAYYLEWLRHLRMSSAQPKAATARPLIGPVMPVALKSGRVSVAVNQGKM